MMQNQISNNAVRGQRVDVYGNLAGQEMGAVDRANQINLGITDQNAQNRGAKQNLLTTGLGQLQQTVQNQKLNKSKRSVDKYKVDLLKQMFPNLRYYGDQFDEKTLAKLIGG